jgi:hypothetical protein
LGAIEGRKRMAAIQKARKQENKYEAPKKATQDWLLREIYKDTKELKEVWCPRVSRLEWLFGGMAIVLGVVSLIVFMIHPQEIADGIAKFFGIL